MDDISKLHQNFIEIEINSNQYYLINKNNIVSVELNSPMVTILVKDTKYNIRCESYNQAFKLYTKLKKRFKLPYTITVKD